MNTLDIFLRAKHWQLFSLTSVLPTATVFGLAWYIKQHSGLGCGNVDNLEQLFYLSIPTLFILPLLTYLGWLWAVVIGVQERLADTSARMNTLSFKVFFITPFVIIGSLIALAWWYGREMQLFSDNYTYAVIAFSILGFLKLCMVAVPFLAAKSIRIAEEQREVSFREVIGTFFLILFFPIGIWFLQPRVNTLV